MCNFFDVCMREVCMHMCVRILTINRVDGLANGFASEPVHVYAYITMLFYIMFMAVWPFMCCICRCMNDYVHVCVFVFLSACACAYGRACVCLCLCKYCVCDYAYMFVLTCIRVFIRMH